MTAAGDEHGTDTMAGTPLVRVPGITTSRDAVSNTGAIRSCHILNAAFMSALLLSQGVALTVPVVGWGGECLAVCNNLLKLDSVFGVVRLVSRFRY